MSLKIVTHHQRPPIPDRGYDWVAFHEGEEEKCEYGYGKTEVDAIADFLINCGIDYREVGKNDNQPL